MKVTSGERKSNLGSTLLQWIDFSCWHPVCNFR